MRIFPELMTAIMGKSSAYNLFQIRVKETNFCSWKVSNQMATVLNFLSQMLQVYILTVLRSFLMACSLSTRNIRYYLQTLTSLHSILPSTTLQQVQNILMMVLFLSSQFIFHIGCQFFQLFHLGVLKKALFFLGLLQICSLRQVQCYIHFLQSSSGDSGTLAEGQRSWKREFQDYLQILYYDRIWNSQKGQQDFGPRRMSQNQIAQFNDLSTVMNVFYLQQQTLMISLE